MGLVTVESDEDSPVVAVVGELDAAGVDAVSTALAAVLQRSRALVVDLGRLDFLDCAGLGALVGLRVQAERAGRPFMLVRPTPPVARLLEFAGGSALLPVHASLDDARTAAAAAGADGHLTGSRPPRRAEMTDETLDPRLAVANEELRVADEELRSQHELIEQMIRMRVADQDAMSQLTSALPVPLLDTDAAGVVAGANTAAGRLLRVGPSLLTGKPIMAFVEAEDRRTVRSALSLALAGRGAQRLNAHLRPRKAASVLADLLIVPAPAGGADSPELAPGRLVAARWVVAPQRSTAAEPAMLDALAELASLAVATTDLRGALTRVAKVAVQAVSGARVASLVVGHPATPDLLVSTGERAQIGDGVQHHAEQGPVWDAYLTGVPVATEQLGQDGRWPRLVRATGRSLGGALAVPVPGADADSPPAGVLAFYGTGALASAGSVARAETFAEVAAAALREHKVVSDLRMLERQLREALESRAVIDQAKGILMGRLGCDADEAFAALVRRSQASNVKLRIIAAQLVAEVSSGRRPTT